MRRLLPLLLIAAVLAGCGKQAPIVGSWSIENPEDAQVGALTGIKVRADFKADKTLALKMTAKAKQPKGEGEFDLVINMTGTYTYQESDSGADLEMVLNDVSVTTEGLAEEFQKVVEDSLAKQKAQMLQTANEQNKFSGMKWDGDDRFIVKNPNGQEATFVRVKV